MNYWAKVVLIILTIVSIIGILGYIFNNPSEEGVVHDLQGQFSFEYPTSLNLLEFDNSINDLAKLSEADLKTVTRSITLIDPGEKKSWNYPINIYVIDEDWMTFYEKLQSTKGHYNTSYIKDNLKTKVNAKNHTYIQITQGLDMGGHASAEYNIFDLNDGRFLIIKLKTQGRYGISPNQDAFENLVDSVKIKQ